MLHEEYRRIVPGAKRAVLFIHGIVGTPNHFRDLIPLVQEVPEDDSIHSILLHGHGGTVRDFSRSSMKQWKDQVLTAFQEMAVCHEQIIVVAHSMGTLFAIQLGIAHPEKIKQLYLLAVPLRPWPRLFGIFNMLRLVFHKIHEDRPLEAATGRACGITTSRKLWQYLGWIPRYLELFREIFRTEKQLPFLTVPTVALQSGNDELVSNRSRKLLKKCNGIEIVDLSSSTHFYYAPEERTFALDTFRKIMKKHD